MKMSIKRANISRLEHEIIRKLEASDTISAFVAAFPIAGELPSVAICSDPGILAAIKSDGRRRTF
jgi:hypothetical protein